jgi:hypothetical protein
MRKIQRLLTILLLCACASALSAKGADIVVLMDSSGTILPWFDEINNRVLGDITKKFVREGDTFHLISFNSRVNLEIAQPVDSEADVSRIVSRFMLLYPIGQNSDFLSGLQYVWQYVSALEQQRDKIVIVISDGIFNPPASSPYASFTSEQIRSELSQMTRKIRGAGWNVYYIKLPFPENAVIKSLDGDLLSGISAGSTAGTTKGNADVTGDTSAGSATGTVAAGAASSGANGDTVAGGKDASGTVGGANASHEYLDVSSEFSSDLDIPRSNLPSDGIPITFIDQVLSIPEVTFPADLGRKGRFFILPIKVKNKSDAPVNMELTGVFIDEDTNVLSKNSFLKVSSGSKGVLRAQINLPDDIPYGKQTIEFRLGFSDNLRVSPQSAAIPVELTPLSLGTVFRTGSSVAFTIAVIALAIVLVLLLVVFITRKTEQPVTDTIRSAAVSTTKKDEEEKKKAGAARTVTGSAPVYGMSSAASAASGRAMPTTGDKAAATSELLSVAANERVASASGLGASRAGDADTSRKAETGYVPEKKQYAAAASAVRTERGISELSSLSESQQAERAERLAVLSQAAVSANHMGARRKGADAGERIEVRGSDRLLLELAVDGQNSHIGKRNIHMMGAGSRLSIGGGNSAFLVFLVKFPSKIAEIRYDGQRCFLAILKPEYFPYERDTVIPFDIGRTFTIVSEKEHEVTFGFRMYEDPVLKLNALLQSII